MSNYQALQKQKKILLAEKKPPRAREAAKQLNISEAEFVALSCGDSCQQLNKDSFVEILQSLETVGEVMALTRNEAMVLESHGIYKDAVSRHGHIIINTDEIDLRLRVSAWQYGFAVDENGRQSLQFFDEFGEATHKIYLTKKSDIDAYQKMVARHTNSDGFDDLNIVDKPAQETLETDIAIDSVAFKKDWAELNDAHQVNGLLNKYNLTRPQAYRHLGDDVFMLRNNGLREMLEIASEKDIPILMFVPNHASTQIHNGTVNKLMEMGPWFNVLDPAFNLHANMNLISETWCVVKKTDDTATYSMEIFDENQLPLMMVYLHPSAKQDNDMQARWANTLKNLKQED